MAIKEPEDTGPWVGLLVNSERIDGVWRGLKGSGRWDFQRKLKK